MRRRHPEVFVVVLVTGSVGSVGRSFISPLKVIIISLTIHALAMMGGFTTPYATDAHAAG